MIRARPVAGDIELGEEFCITEAVCLAKKFGFCRHPRYPCGETPNRPPWRRNNCGERTQYQAWSWWYPGDRIFAQTQQLIWGGRVQRYAVKNLESVLDALVEHGRIGQDTATDLLASYRYLRRIEHRLQMIDDKQTHELPKTDEKVEEVAVFAGYQDGAAFRVELVENLQRVERHYAALFEDSQDLGAQGSLVFTGNELHPDTKVTLHDMGFDDPAGSSTQSVFGITGDIAQREAGGHDNSSPNIANCSVRSRKRPMPTSHSSNSTSSSAGFPPAYSCCL